MSVNNICRWYKDASDNGKQHKAHTFTDEEYRGSANHCMSTKSI